ncbi:type II secretion system F family protein [endosymbiont 'TC1' of Trimyema compressum]|uniref:type II secretion system F family protein n=1 Tax=endosymbiont 'TC1' of Trimyema compressum TaxID=243899 RepID=UPI0013922B06|nr:hypothetical protein [endosymbiont 'TC1' of Trimyema compressum]
MENSLKRSLQDLENIHGEDGLLSPYLKKCLYYYGLGKPIESGLFELTQLYPFDWLAGFIDMIGIARIKVGDFINLIKKTSQIISDRIEIEGEIEVVLAKQNLELKILRGMPFILLLILKNLYPEMIVFLTSQFSGQLYFLIAFSVTAFIYRYEYIHMKSIIKKKKNSFFKSISSISKSFKNIFGSWCNIRK